MPSSSFLPLATHLGNEICLQNQNQVGDSSNHHHCHSRLLLRFPGVDCNLFAKPLSQCLLPCCSGSRSLLGPLSSALLMTRSTMSDAPEDEVVAARVPLDRQSLSPGISLVLQVSPLHGGPDPDEFFYNPFAGVESDNFCSGPCILHPPQPHHCHPLMSRCHCLPQFISFSYNWLHFLASQETCQRT